LHISELQQQLELILIQPVNVYAFTGEMRNLTVASVKKSEILEPCECEKMFYEKNAVYEKNVLRRK